MQTSIVSTVKAPRDQTLAFVHYHLNLGIDKIFLYLDDPRDLAYEEIFNSPRVSITRCDRNYRMETGSGRKMPIEKRQVRNANHALQTALNAGIEWITHIDCDELIYPTVDIKKYLCGVKADVQLVRMVLHEAIAADPFADSIFAGVENFKNLASPLDLETAMSRGCVNALLEGKYLRGHIRSKCWVRVSPTIKSMGIHNPKWATQEKVRQIDSNDVHLLHYDCTTLDSWMRKWMARIDGSGTANKMGANRRRQMDLFKSHIQNNDDTELLALFKRLHCVEPNEMAILSQLGLVSNIFVDPSSFLASDEPGPVAASNP